MTVTELLAVEREHVRRLREELREARIALELVLAAAAKPDDAALAKSAFREARRVMKRPEP